MRIEIRYSFGFGDWVWSCPVCDYDAPDCEPTFPEAIAAVDKHIAKHRWAGTYTTWRPV